jgi:hypothetical protein
MRFIGAFKTDQSPESGTLAALQSAAEAHYTNALLRWALEELAAGRATFATQPSKPTRKDFWNMAYDRVVTNLQDFGATPYIGALEQLRTQEIASVDDSEA